VKSRAYENSSEKPLCELLTKIQGVTANLPSRVRKKKSMGWEAWSTHEYAAAGQPSAPIIVP
jgi:hypothetical protein